MDALPNGLEWLNFAPEPIIVSNGKSEILFINREAGKLLGYENSVPDRKKLADLFIDFDLSDLVSGEQHSATTELRKTELVWVKRTDGQTFPATVTTGRVILQDQFFLISSIRISEKDLTTPATLSEQYKLLVKTINKLPEGIQILDRNFRYLYLNDIVVVHSKYNREDLLGFTMMEKYPGIENTTMFQHIVECLKDGKPRSMTNEFVFPDKSSGFFHLNIEPIPEGVFIISLDITEIIKIREALIEKNRKLELMNTELEQFAYIASHDLQEPLKTISSCIRMLNQMLEGKTEKDADQLLKFIGSATTRMQELILVLLEYSRIGKEAVHTQVNCMELLQQVTSDMQLTIAENQCRIKIDPLPVITACAADMRMLFQNLISNAIKFRQKNIAPELHISCIENTDYWIFSVQDNGIGIEEKYQKKIFAIFQRLHLRHEYEGTGIGLARCKKIVQLHGGELWVESEPGAGSKFSFSISKKQQS